jgi:hypothetical protein
MKKVSFCYRANLAARNERFSMEFDFFASIEHCFNNDLEQLLKISSQASQQVEFSSSTSTLPATDAFDRVLNETAIKFQASFDSNSLWNVFWKSSVASFDTRSTATESQWRADLQCCWRRLSSIVDVKEVNANGINVSLTRLTLCFVWMRVLPFCLWLNLERCRRCNSTTTTTTIPSILSQSITTILDGTIEELCLAMKSNIEPMNEQEKNQDAARIVIGIMGAPGAGK